RRAPALPAVDEVGGAKDDRLAGRRCPDDVADAELDARFGVEVEIEQPEIGAAHPRRAQPHFGMLVDEFGAEILGEPRTHQIVEIIAALVGPRDAIRLALMDIARDAEATGDSFVA